MSHLSDWLAGRGGPLQSPPERAEVPAEVAGTGFDRTEAAAKLDAIESELERFLGRRQGRIPSLLAELRSMLS